MVQASGDVGFLAPAQSLTDEPRLKEKETITGSIRYISVLKEAGHHLTDFLCTRDLANAVHDATIGTIVIGHLELMLMTPAALSMAFVLEKFRHCNITVGNISVILDEDRKFKRGLLFDWDLCNDQMKSRVSERNRIVGGLDAQTCEV